MSAIINDVCMNVHLHSAFIPNKFLKLYCNDTSPMAYCLEVLTDKFKCNE